MTNKTNTTRCIILKYTEYKDNTYIIKIYAEGYGIISINAKIGKKSKVRGAYLAPLARLDCILAIRPSREIHSISECNLRNNIIFSPSNAIIKMLLAEVLLSTLKEQQNENQLFEFIESSLELLEQNNSDCLNFHLIFLIQYSRYLGFFPNISNFSEGSIFDLKNAVFTKEIPLHNMHLTKEQTVNFANLLRGSYNNMHLFKLTRQERNETLKYMMLYYSLHIPEFREPTTIDIIQNM